MDSDEIKEFAVEAKELLDDAENALLAIGQGAEFKKHYDAIFRAFHSIKGASGMLGMNSLQAHMHQLENLLTKKARESTLDELHVDFFLKGVDGARKILDGTEIQFDYQVLGVPASAPKPSQEALVQSSDPKIQSTKPITNNSKIGKVLCVDDEPDILDFLDEVLTESGFEVKKAHSVSVALKQFDEFSPDLIFSDYKMPDESGYELLKKVRAIDPEIPICFVSAHVDKDFLIESIKLGVDGVVQKPFSIHTVIQLATQLCIKGQTQKLLKKSVDLLLFQYSDLDSFLASQGKNDARQVLADGIKAIMDQRNMIRAFHKKIGESSQKL